MSTYKGYRRLVITYENNDLSSKKIIDKLDIEQLILLKLKTFIDKPISMIIIEKYYGNNWEMEDIVYMNVDVNAIYLQSLMAPKCQMCVNKYTMIISHLISKKYEYLFNNEPIINSSCKSIVIDIPKECKC